MHGTLFEKLSGRKLLVFVSILLLVQLTCFLIGGLVAPVPVNAQNILGTVCKDTSTVKNDTTKWFYNRGKGQCQRVDLGDLHQDLSETDIVFAFQMPIPRESQILDYSRWQQNLIGVLQVDIRYHSQMEVKPRSVVTIDARLAYMNKGDPENSWKLYTHSKKQRHLDCEIEVPSEEYLYNCSAIPLFELGSLYHDYYLLNVRLPVDTPEMNAHIGHIQDMWLTVINQNGGFTKVWLSLKTVFFPCIIAILVWFWRRIHMLQRKPVLMEKMLLSLGIALCVLNMPIEYLTLFFDLPFMPLLEDVIQGVFYAMLFSFWLVFAGEHMLIQETSTLKQYRRQISAVGTGFTLLLLFDMYIRGEQLENPFNSIWVTDFGANVVATIMTLTYICIGIYFLYLCYLNWKVFKNMSDNLQPNNDLIYRYKLLLVAIIIYATMTVASFIKEQMTGQWKLEENLYLKRTSCFYMDVYAMWNIYTFALLLLYSPYESSIDIQNLSKEIFTPLSRDKSTNEVDSNLDQKSSDGTCPTLFVSIVF